MIPKILHFIWLGELPIPKTVTLWETINPDWEIRLWTDRNLPSFRNYSVFMQAHEHKNLQADILRVNLLYQFGGVYMDIDVIPFKPIDPLFSSSDKLVCAWESVLHTPGILANTFMASIQYHPVWLELIVNFSTLVFPKNMVYRTTRAGPKKVTPYLLQHNPRILPDYIFYPEWCNTKNRNPRPEVYPNSYGFHLWAHTNELQEFGW